MACATVVAFSQTVPLPRELRDDPVRYRNFVQPQNNRSARVSNAYVQEKIREYDTQIGAEATVEIQKPEGFSLASITNNVLNVSLLAELEAYNSEEEEFEVFIRDAYRFIGKRSRIGAPVFASVPDEYTQQIVMDTEAYGEAEYGYTLKKEGNGIVVEIINTTDLRLRAFSLIRIAKKEEYKKLMYIEEREDSLILYAFTGIHSDQLKPDKRLAPKETIRDTLTSQAIALISWVKSNL